MTFIFITEVEIIKHAIKEDGKEVGKEVFLEVFEKAGFKKPALVASLFFFDPIPLSNGFSKSTMLLLPVAPVLVTPVAPVVTPVAPLAPVNDLP